MSEPFITAQWNQTLLYLGPWPLELEDPNAIAGTGSANVHNPSGKEK